MPHLRPGGTNFWWSSMDILRVRLSSFKRRSNIDTLCKQNRVESLEALSSFKPPLETIDERISAEGEELRAPIVVQARLSKSTDGPCIGVRSSFKLCRLTRRCEEVRDTIFAWCFVSTLACEDSFKHSYTGNCADTPDLCYEVPALRSSAYSSSES